MLQSAKSLVFCTLFVTLVLSPVSASTSRCVAQADAVESEHFAIFVNMFDALQKEVAKRSRESDPRSKTLENATQQLFGFDEESDYNNGRIVLADIKSRLDKSDEEERAYFEKCRTNKQPVDPIVAEQFYAKHKQLLVSGIEDLKKKISPSAWQGLRNFLNTKVKPNITPMVRVK